MRASPVVALILALVSPAQAEEAHFLASFTWESPEEAFGGFSGIEISNDGHRLWVLGDSGDIATATISRGADDRISAIDLESLAPLEFATSGQRLAPGYEDAEGLALGPDGRLYASFEVETRIRELLPDPFHTRIITDHPDFERFPPNGALEAIAITPEGAVCTIPEHSGGLQHPFPVYCWQDAGWSLPYWLPRRGNFLVTGADFGPDGRLYVLERNFKGIFGFRSRVRVFTPEDGVITSETTLFETTSSLHQNLEGLAVWRDSAGAIRLTMISDDNFQPFLRTEVVEYRVTE